MSSTKKSKLSTSTALVVVPVPPVPATVPTKQARKKAWKVYRIYCGVTKSNYFGICLSYKTINGLVSSFNYGVRVGNSEISVSSIRQHGMENHVFTFVSPNFDTRAEALKAKGEAILRFSRNRPLLNQNAQAECEIEINRHVEVPDQFRGRLSPSWADADNAGEDTDGE